MKCPTCGCDNGKTSYVDNNTFVTDRGSARLSYAEMKVFKVLHHNMGSTVAYEHLLMQTSSRDKLRMMKIIYNINKKIRHLPFIIHNEQLIGYYLKDVHGKAHNNAPQCQEDVRT